MLRINLNIVELSRNLRLDVVAEETIKINSIIKSGILNNH